jgi:uncharacterized protein (DUF2225 family)
MTKNKWKKIDRIRIFLKKEVRLLSAASFFQHTEITSDSSAVNKGETEDEILFFVTNDCI